MMILNKKLFKNYEFSMLDGQVYCLTSIVKEKSLCERKLTKKLQDIFRKSEIIIISQSWSKRDLKRLDDVVKILKNENKEIYITSQIPGFYFKNSRNIIDEFYYENKRLPNLSEKEELEIRKFNSKKPRIVGIENSSTVDVNKFLKIYTKLNNINFLDKEDFLCKVNKNKCYVLTDDNEKIFFDETHLTLSGAKFFGNIIYESNWLNLK